QATRSQDRMVVGVSADSLTYAAFLPQGGTISLDLTALAGTTVGVTWYDPRTGHYRDQGTHPVVPCAPLARPLGPANQRWYSWRSDCYHWRGRPSQSGMYSCRQVGKAPPHLLERHVQALTRQTAAWRDELLPECPRLPVCDM